MRGMAFKGHCRGNPIICIPPEKRYRHYKGTVEEMLDVAKKSQVGEFVTDAEYDEMPCVKCHKAPVKGMDACIANSPGVKNACCGHGFEFWAYVEYEDGTVLREQEAIDAINT